MIARPGRSTGVIQVTLESLPGFQLCGQRKKAGQQGRFNHDEVARIRVERKLRVDPLESAPTTVAELGVSDDADGRTLSGVW